MRILLCLLLLILVAVPAAFSQAASGNPSGEIERAREQAMNDRLRGKTVMASDETLKPGRDYNFVAIKQKTIELNELIQAVNGDVVQASKGVLSADMNKRLKRIEKLAKEIRKEFE